VDNSFPEIIVVIPTYNSESTIKKCLDSIFKLDYPNFKVVIVDGHSKDNTIKIASKYNVEILFENIGNRAGACNVAIEKFSDKFIAFTDADCVVEPNWLNELYKTINDSNDIGCATGPNITPSDSSKFSKGVGIVLGSFLGSGFSTHAKIKNKFIEVESAPGCNVLYRDGIFNKIGVFDTNLKTAEDADINYRLRKNGYRIIYNPNALVYHYRRPNSLKFFKKMYYYGIGRAKLIKKSPKTIRFYYILPPLALLMAIPTLLMFIFGIFPLKYLFWGLIALVSLLFLLASYYAIKYKQFYLIFLFPYLYLIEFFGWSLGFIYGLFI